ncbi:hypothetical protein IWW36_004442, partial [Coemansia brasiliensis]
WLQILRFSKNQIKFCRELERRVADSRKMHPSSRPLVDLAANKQDDDDDSAEGAAKKTASIVSALSRAATATKYDPAALLKVVEQSGIDISDFAALNTACADGSERTGNDDPEEAMFLPGSLLTRPKKSALEAEAEQSQHQADMFAKGSLLAQSRESKALAASRAMQTVMAQNGNVFTQGSLLQVSDEKKPRPPHIGGAAHVPQPQFPLVQIGDDNAAQMPQFRAPAYAGSPAVQRPYAAQNLPEEPVVFGGLLASQAQTPQHPHAHHPTSHHNYRAFYQ